MVSICPRRRRGTPFELDSSLCDWQHQPPAAAVLNYITLAFSPSLEWQYSDQPHVLLIPASGLNLNYCYWLETSDDGSHNLWAGGLACVAFDKAGDWARHRRVTDLKFPSQPGMSGHQIQGEEEACHRECRIYSPTCFSLHGLYFWWRVWSKLTRPVWMKWNWLIGKLWILVWAQVFGLALILTRSPLTLHPSFTIWSMGECAEIFHIVIKHVWWMANYYLLIRWYNIINCW